MAKWTVSAKGTVAFGLLAILAWKLGAPTLLWGFFAVSAVALHVFGPAVDRRTAALTVQG